MPDSEIRKLAAAVSTPKLDAFRARVKESTTSGLVLLLSDPAAVHDIVSDPGPRLGIGELLMQSERFERVQLLIAAAIIAVRDELDRRVPVPG